jgi:hypothetical protein
VKDYFATQPGFPKLPSVGAPPQVVKVQFMTSQELADLLGMSLGRPAPALLCYVNLRGTFQVSGPLSQQGQPSVTTVNCAYAVFDAHTGNLLLAGTRPDGSR